MDVLFDFHKPGDDDPFADEPLPAAHYCPSTHKQLTQREKQVKLSAHSKDVLISDDYPLKSKHDSKKHLSPGERRFLHQSNTMLAQELPTHDTPSPRDRSSKFDESWPTSERPSTIESPSEISQTSSKVTSIGRNHHSDLLNKPGVSSLSVGGWGSDDISRDVDHWRSSLATKESPLKESTLAKYIHRFRYSEPMSRQERARKTAAPSQPREFWWMSPPSRSSTPSDDIPSSRTDRPFLRVNRTDQFSHRAPVQMNRTGHVITQKSGVGRGSALSSTLSQKIGRYHRYPLHKLQSNSSVPSSSTLSSTLLDDATRQLQDKADRLLERSESTLLSEPPAVSSEGVGLSPSTDDSLYLPGISHAPEDKENILKSVMHAQPGTYGTLRPEDDILYQWRVRRRLEHARQHTQTTVGHVWNLGESTILTAQAKKPSGADSRLEEFRRHLKQQETLSQLHHGATNPLLETGDVCNAGTDPIPQSISTQTSSHGRQQDSLALYSEATQNRHHGVHGGCEQDVPVRDTTGESQRGSNTHGDNRNKEYDSLTGDINTMHLIASPHIERTHAPMREVSIVPHLHLACDIVPCDQSVPHMHSKDVIDSSVPQQTQVRKESGIQRSYHQGLQRHSEHERVRLRQDYCEQQDNAPVVTQDERHVRNDKWTDNELPQYNMNTKQQGDDNRNDSNSAIQSDSNPRQKLDFKDVEPQQSPRTPPRATGTRDESTLLSEPPAVSSEGVGLSPSTDDSLYLPGISHAPEDKENILKSVMHAQPGTYGTLRPEDDILYQWRVRRRLEHARQHTQTTVGHVWNLGESTILTAQAKKPSGADSRLEEFRRHLKQQETLSQLHHGATNPLLETGDVCNAGTDPIPQSISTQTSSHGRQQDSLALYSEATQNRHHGVHGGCEQDVPVRDTTGESQRGSNTHGDNRNKEYDSLTGDINTMHLIASPHIERTHAPMREVSIVPHLHLACDIVPCDQSVPHMHSKDVIDSSVPQQTQVRKESGIQRSYHQGLQRHSEHERVRLRQDYCEQQDNAPVVTQDERHVRNDKWTDNELPQYNMNTKQQGDDNRNDSNSAIQSDSNPRQKLDFKDVEPQQSPRTPPRATGTREYTGDGMVRGQRLQKHVSSSPVGLAIDQVISSRLFTSTPTPVTNSPGSSVNTLPSMQHSLSTQCDSVVQYDDTESDGDFEEDELLQMLRHRRAIYEQQLQQLDQLIQSTQDHS